MSNPDAPNAIQQALRGRTTQEKIMKYRQFRLTHSLTQAQCAELLGVGERHWRTLEASNKPIALKHWVMLDYALKQGGEFGSPQNDT